MMHLPEPARDALIKMTAVIGGGLISWGGVTLVNGVIADAEHDRDIANLQAQQEKTVEVLEEIRHTVHGVDHNVAVIEERTRRTQEE